MKWLDHLQVISKVGVPTPVCKLLDLVQVKLDIYVIMYEWIKDKKLYIYVRWGANMDVEFKHMHVQMKIKDMYAWI